MGWMRSISGNKNEAELRGQVRSQTGVWERGGGAGARETRAQAIHGGSIASDGHWLAQASSAAGVSVNESTMLNDSAVLAVFRLLGDTAGMMPLHVKRKDGSGVGRAIDRMHPLHQLVHVRPNPEMSAFELKQWRRWECLTWGAALCEIEYGGNGWAKWLWPVPRRRWNMERVNGEIVYKIFNEKGGGFRMLPASDVLLVRGYVRDSLAGVSTLQLGRETIGLSLAQAEFQARLFPNGVHGSGIWVSFPDIPEKAERDRVEREFNAKYGGVMNAGKTPILYDGGEIKTLGSTNEALQFIQGRQFSIQDVSRISGVPVHLLAELSKATFSNIEQLAIEFVRFVTLPWCERDEQQLDWSLLRPSGMQTHELKYNQEVLLKADFATRMEGYRKSLQDGWMTANEIRDLEGHGPLSDGTGDEPMLLGNFVTRRRVVDGTAGAGIEAGSKTSAFPNRSGEDFQRRGAENAEARGEEQRAAVLPARLELRGIFEPLLAGAYARIARREKADLGRLAEKTLAKNDVEEFARGAAKFWETHGDFCKEALGPVVDRFTLAMGLSAGREIGWVENPRARGEQRDAASDAAALVEEIMAALAEARTSAAVAQWIEANRAVVDEIIETARAQILAMSESAGSDATSALQKSLAANAAERAKREAVHQIVKIGELATRAAWEKSGRVLEYQWNTSGETCPLCMTLKNRRTKKAFVEKDGVVDPQDGSTAPLVVKKPVASPPIHRGCDCYLTPVLI